jgi:RNA polymerase sigma-70 factor, ECF subfamily
MASGSNERSVPDVSVTKSLIDNYFEIAARAVLVKTGIASFAFEHLCCPPCVDERNELMVELVNLRIYMASHTFDPSRGMRVARMTADRDITALLTALQNGDRSAMERLLALVYDDLRMRAHGQLARARPGDTLSTTALVHEAYLKLAGSSQSYQNRAHFFAVASRAMRQILVDYVRRNLTAKRDGGHAISLDPELIGGADRGVERNELVAALEELEQVDERLARTVELRFFGGLSVEETAELLEVSPRTVKRDWRKARAFLYRAMQGEPTMVPHGPDRE